jgi:hypothetical protein
MPVLVALIRQCGDFDLLGAGKTHSLLTKEVKTSTLSRPKMRAARGWRNPARKSAGSLESGYNGGKCVA